WSADVPPAARPGAVSQSQTVAAPGRVNFSTRQADFDRKVPEVARISRESGWTCATAVLHLGCCGLARNLVGRRPGGATAATPPGRPGLPCTNRTEAPRQAVDFARCSELSGGKFGKSAPSDRASSCILGRSR